MSADRKTPSIPDVQGLDGGVSRILKPMRELLMHLTGKLPGQKAITRLEGTVTLADVQNKLNDVIDRMNQ